MSLHSKSMTQGFALVQLLLVVVALVLVVGVGYLLLAEKTAVGLSELPGTLPSDAVRQPSPQLVDRVSGAISAAVPTRISDSGRDEGHAYAMKAQRPAAQDQPAAGVAAQRADLLPRLNQSDSAFRSALVQLDPSRQLTGWLIDEEMIRKLVVTIDNMADGKIPRKHGLLLPINSKFRASEKAGQVWLDGYNHGRYRPYVELLSAISSQQWLALYRRYYPLMQQAYAELGYPNKAFHERVLQALDHLLQSPLISRALVLEQPSVMYRFADPELEQLSAVHKQMLRLGPVNARQIMDRLTVLRAGLSRLPPE